MTPMITLRLLFALAGLALLSLATLEVAKRFDVILRALAP